mgnify:CR=1 FL=1
MLQTITQVGNSAGLILSKPLLEEAQIKIGTKVNISYKADMGGLFIEIPNKQLLSKSSEFNTWLHQFMNENGEILDELATR